MRLSANLSLLWTELPFEERFARAAARGFPAVELWWPGDREIELLPELTRRNGLELSLVNFYSGDRDAGDRGLVSDPMRRDEFRGRVPTALRVARDAGCGCLNALFGVRAETFTYEEQLECARENVRWAAELAARDGVTVTVEAISSRDGVAYLVDSTAEAARFVESLGVDNVRLQYDLFQMHRMGEDLAATMAAFWDLIGYVQIADAPGRIEPGAGEIDFAPVFALLRERGYDGFLGAEYDPTGETDASFGWLDELALRGD